MDTDAHVFDVLCFSLLTLNNKKLRTLKTKIHLPYKTPLGKWPIVIFFSAMLPVPKI